MSQTPIPRAMARRVARESHYRCGYCLASEAFGIPMEFDHLIPESAGGETAANNLWLACGRCNGFKVDRVRFRDPLTRRIVRLFNPRFDDWIESCDLANKKAPLVAMCPIFGIPSIVAIDTRFQKPKELENLRKGRYEGLYTLASPDDPNNNQQAKIVDFRQIFSLPPQFVEAHALSLGNRWRLQSPFLEHFSQAFARFFMRIGLPSSVPEFM